MADKPDYYYANQWADELASAYTMASQTAPSLAFDLSSANLPKVLKSDMAASVLQSNIDPYA